MQTTRRHFIAGLAAAPSLMLPASYAFGAEPLKISHQFPGGSEKEGDFRHRLCDRFAKEASTSAATAPSRPTSIRVLR